MMSDVTKILKEILSSAGKVGKGKFIFDNFDDIEVDEKVKAEKTIKVKKPGAWSSFEYIFDPKTSNTLCNKDDDRIYFSIPVSYDYDSKIVYHYMFPINAVDSEIVLYYTDLSDFYSAYNMVKVSDE